MKTQKLTQNQLESKHLFIIESAKMAYLIFESSINRKNKQHELA